MLNLRSMGDSLQCADEDNDVDSCMCQIGHCSKQALVELVEFRAAQFLWACAGQLGMLNDPQILGELD